MMMGVVVTLLIWGAVSLRVVPVMAVGVISDSHCGLVHRAAETPGVTDRDCILGCLRNGAQYVFVSRDTTYGIHNQGFTDLATYAGRVVQISGAAHRDVLTVAHVAALP
jgi:hypothetical protein